MVQNKCHLLVAKSKMETLLKSGELPWKSDGGIAVPVPAEKSQKIRFGVFEVDIQIILYLDAIPSDPSHL
jgi:hypothetical protein